MICSLRRRSWPPFIRLSGEIMTVGGIACLWNLRLALLLTQIPLYSHFYRYALVVCIIHLASHWLSTYPSADHGRFRAADHPCADAAWLLPLGISRDFAWSRRACALYTVRGQELEPATSRNRRMLPCRLTSGCFSHSTRCQGRSVA